MANEINTGKFMVIITSLIVGIVLIMGVLVPIISNSTDNGGGSDDGETYTNTGSWYYNKATASSNTTISLGTSTDQILHFKYVTLTVDNGSAITTEFPLWTSSASADISAIPLFIYKMSNGKYGVEGLVSGYGGTNYNDVSNFSNMAGAMYYRFTQGDSEPTLYDIFSGDGATITLANGHVTVTVGNDTVVPAINGTYELYFTGNTSGDYTIGDGVTVLDSTKFYICGYAGSADYDNNNIIYGEDTCGCIGQGTLSTITQPSNITLFGARATSPLTASIETEDASEGDGKVLNSVDVSELSGGGLRGCFLVPTTVGGDSGGSGMSPIIASILSVIPIIMIVGMIMITITYFIGRKNL